MNLKTLYQKTLEVYGKNDQINKLIEELNELAVAAAHIRDRENNEQQRQNFIEELADVSIMIQQMIAIFQIQKEVYKIIIKKRQRLANKLKSIQIPQKEIPQTEEKPNLKIYTGEMIRYHRKMKNLTQKELSEKVGVCRDTILRTEKGMQNIPIKQLEKILKALEINLGDFFK
jgi:DNA-binding XRE family transcriptional regulator